MTSTLSAGGATAHLPFCDSPLLKKKDISKFNLWHSSDRKVAPLKAISTHGLKNKQGSPQVNLLAFISSMTVLCLFHCAGNPGEPMEEDIKQEKVEKTVTGTVKTEGEADNKKGVDEEKAKEEEEEEEEAAVKSRGEEEKQTEDVGEKNKAKNKDDEKVPEEEEAETKQQPLKESPKSQTTTEQKDKETPPKKPMSSFFGKQRFALNSSFNSPWFRFIVF